MLRKPGHLVPALKIVEIRKVAIKIRSILTVCGAPAAGRLDIIKVLDIFLPSILPNFECEIVEDTSLNGDLARTYPDKQLIQVAKSTYDAARNGDGQSIFTIAHEIGHLFLHRNISTYARAASVKAPPITYCDSEWQADTFAAEFLMPYNECLLCNSAFEIKSKFGVSNAAALYRFSKLKK